MRKIMLIFILITNSILGFSQLKNKYEVIEESNLTKDQLFKNSQNWVLNNFKTYGDVVQIENKADGNLVIKGNTPIDIGYTKSLAYKISISCKDLKYRIVIEQIDIISEFSTYDVSKHQCSSASYTSQIDSLNIQLDKAKKKDKEDIELMIKVLKKLDLENTLVCNKIPVIIENLILSIKSEMKNNDDW